jgi:hypothetical protein
MLRRLARTMLLLAFAASLASTTLTAARIASDPLITPFAEAAADQIVAATNRMLAQAATPETLRAHISNRLAEEPRNWLALDALVALAAERAIPLPDDLTDTLQIAREDDHGYYAQATSCAACAYDPAECNLSQVMICQAPIALSPIGDITGITRAGVAYATGAEVDQIDLALSVVGLGATAAVLASGGSSVVVKAGAGLAKLARRMGRLSPRLVGMATDAVRGGVDWARLPAVRSLDDLTAAIRADAFAPLTNTLADLERLRAATSTTTALHLLPLVDDATDANRLARAAKALGPKLTGRAEVLGKARLFRATLRVSETGWALVSGLAGLMLSVAMMLAGMVQHRLLHLLRRRLRA